MLQKVFVFILSFITALCLCYGLFGFGVLICMLPETTQLLGSSFLCWDHKVFPEQTMAQIAEAVRSFCVDGSDPTVLTEQVSLAIEQNYPALAEVIGSIDMASSSQIHELLSSYHTSSVSDLVSTFTLSSNVMSHLSDCVEVFLSVRISIGICLAFALVGIVILAIMHRRKLAGQIMTTCAFVVIVVMVGLSVWAVLDFDSFFSLLHSLFFTSGSWLFDPDSLLIQLFPEIFWVGMGAVWVISSIAASILAVIVGKLLKH